MPQAVSPFTLDTFEQHDPYAEDADVAFARAAITKTFTGDIVATSTVEMLSVTVGGHGAGYVAVERVTGAVGGRSGSFAVLHVGTMSGGDYWARWPVVPGSGTGELAGMSGEGRIEIAADGAHTFFLDYELA